MEKQTVKLKITTISTGNPVNVIKGTGYFREKDGRILITHTDNKNVKTAFMITNDRITLSRSAELYSLKVPVKSGEALLGIMGEENTFSVIGKTAEYERFKTGGKIFLEYTLPDLSDISMDFKVEAEFSF